MVSKKYLLAAKGLADRNKNRLNTKRSPKEQERDELFFWLISRLEWSVQNCWPAKKFHNVTVKEGYCHDKNRVLLEHGKVSQYISQYVTRDEFYSVMQEVADIFNQISKREDGENHFYAVCFPTDRNAELTVNLATNI